ncbi:MAG: hypothetical protein WC719_02465 [Patescibacteria group bacterium]
MNQAQEDGSIEPELLAPFKLITSVSRYRCDCGHISEIPLNSAQAFIRTMGILGAFPEIILAGDEDLKNYYFKINHCKLCRQKKSGEKILIQLKLLKQGLK